VGKGTHNIIIIIIIIIIIKRLRVTNFANALLLVDSHFSGHALFVGWRLL